MWTQVFLPMWMEFLGMLEDPWDNTNLLTAVQELWDEVFKHNPQIFQVKREPIFAVVCFPSSLLCFNLS